MDNQQLDDDTKAKIEALRRLRSQGFYQPEQDNPEHLDVDSPQVPQEGQEQTMQANPQNLLDALRRKRQQDMIDQFTKKGD